MMTIIKKNVLSKFADRHIQRVKLDLFWHK